MKTIAHISDLHFGREDPVVAEGLRVDLHRLEPDVLVNTGDFTQRARWRQFRAAAAYMRRLPQPQVCVPGNHDIPLFDVFRRFLSPLARYRRYITPELFPHYADDELVVLGINTARSLTWKSGRISAEQIEELERVLSAIPASTFKVVISHHPFIPPPGESMTGVDLVGRAARALEVLERGGVDLLLAGHLHHGYTGDIRTFYPSTQRSIIVAQAGTAISHRMHREPNGYNFIRLERDYIEVTVRRWLEGAFVEISRVVFRLEDGQWLPQASVAGSRQAEQRAAPSRAGPE